MSNIAGKAYAMTLMTPIKVSINRLYVNRAIFWLAGLKLFQKRAFNGLYTLSLIHYARWVIIGRNSFPRLSEEQPKEELKYAYMMFFSNFNGSWTQYVDSFSMAIPTGLDLIWRKNVGWPNAVPETPFNRYVIKNQIWNSHYYSAYPLATSNDVKSAQKVKKELVELSDELYHLNADSFKEKYDALVLGLQNDLSQMEPTPVVSLASQAIEKRARIEEGQE